MSVAINTAKTSLGLRFPARTEPTRRADPTVTDERGGTQGPRDPVVAVEAQRQSSPLNVPRCIEGQRRAATLAAGRRPA
jgi:hypothetical protein